MAIYDRFVGLTNPYAPRSAPIDWTKRYMNRDSVQAVAFDLDVATLIAEGVIPATGLVATDVVQVELLPDGFTILGGTIVYAGWGADDPSAVTCDMRLYVPGTAINNPGALTGTVDLMSGSSAALAGSITLKYGITVGHKAHAADPHDAGYLGRPAALAIRMVAVTTAGAGATVGRIRGHVLGFRTAT